MNEHHFADAAFVRVVNRTSKPLTVTYNGRQAKVPPYPGHIYMTAVAAEKAVQQNRRLGTEDPYNPRDFESLLGVEGWSRFPCTPVEQSTAVEAANRSLLPADVQHVELRDVATRRVIERQPLHDVDVHAFVDPTPGR